MKGESRRGSGGAKILQLEDCAISATGAEWVDLLRDEGLDIGVEIVQMRIGVGRRDLGESL